MELTELLIESYKRLDAAQVEDGLGNEALCMFHLGILTGGILKFIAAKEKQDPPERKSEQCQPKNSSNTS